jgi:hypothetical protein
MKLKEIDKMLLTKEDMANRDKLDKRLDEMLEKVEEYKSKIMKEYAEKEDVNAFKTLHNSTDKYNKLIRTYNSYDKCNEAIILGIVCGFMGMFTLLNSPLIGELKPTLIMISVTIFGVVFSINGFKQKLIKSKIKKNFKELGIELG